MSILKCCSAHIFGVCFFVCAITISVSSTVVAQSAAVPALGSGGSEYLTSLDEMAERMDKSLNVYQTSPLSSVNAKSSFLECEIIAAKAEIESLGVRTTESDYMSDDYLAAFFDCMVDPMISAALD